MFLNSNGSLPFFHRPKTIMALALLMCALPLSVSGFELIVGAGPEGSFSNYIGKVLCRKLEKHQPDISCTLSNPADQVDYLTNVQGGSLDLALIDSRLLYDAQQGTGPFAFLDISYDRIRIIAPLYHVPLTVLVHTGAEVSSSDQLPGTRINIGAAGSAEHLQFFTIMQAYGWTARDFPLLGELSSSMSQDTIAFRQTTFQAMIHRGVHPDRSIGQLLGESSSRLLGFTGEPISSMLSNAPALETIIIPGDTYQDISEDIITFGTATTLVTSSDLDDDTARAIGAMLIEEAAILRTMHPALSTFQMTDKAEFFGGLKAHPALLEEIRRR